MKLNHDQTLAVDEYGRAITVPEGESLPDGAEEVDQETWGKIKAGAPRVYTQTVDGREMVTVSQGGMTWAPTSHPGDDWVEVTDQDEIDRILESRQNDGDHEDS